MFKKFGFGGKKEEPKQQVAAPPQSVDKALQYEKAIHDIRTKIQVMDDNMERVDQKVVTLDQQIRDLLGQKKQQQAKGKIAELKGYQKQIETNQTKRNVLTQMMIQMENLEQDGNMLDVVQNVTSIAKDHQQINDKLSDAMLDYNEFQQSNVETQELWKQMGSIGVDQDDLDDTFAQYEKEVNAEQSQDLNNKFDKIPQQQIQQPKQQIAQPQQQSVYKSKQDEQFQSNVQSMLE